MTQQWGTPGQQPNQGGQWGQPNWNRPAQAWGPPAAGRPQQPYAQPQYPPAQQPYPPAPGYPQGQYANPQAQFGQPAYSQPGMLQPPNRGNQPGGPRRRPFRGLLLGLVLVIGVIFFAISLLHYLGADSELATPGNLPTVAPTTPPVEVPEPDFDPPAVPQPETYGEATEWLTNNSVYAETAPVPTACQVPEIDITTASVVQLTGHLNDLTACLWTVWSVPLKDAGFQLPRPPVTVYTEPITTGCGSLDEVNAVYCAADQHIYYAKPLYKIFPADQQRARFVVEAVLAHEFGHTIQARTGILISSMALEQKATKAEARVYSRRLEVQADCFSGMFTEAVGESSGLSNGDLTNLQEVMYNLGDDVLSGKANIEGDHGLGKSRKNWFTVGQQNTLMGKCNTYTAPATSVR